MELLIIIIIGFIIYYAGKAVSRKEHQEQVRQSNEFKPSRPRQNLVDPDSVWIRQGESIRIAGKDIPGGMLYVGRYLQSAGGYADIEPALINPKLKVNWSKPDYQGTMMSYWPSYSQIDPSCRAAFLDWLANGRSSPGAYIGYVFIFFYALERRFFSDTKDSEAARSEIPVIIEEVRRLIRIYGDNRSFNSYANNLLNAAHLMQSPEKTYENTPPEERAGWTLPMSLLLGLGQLVSEGKSIPANWAFSWVTLHPETRLRTPATRCKKEFKKLFENRYNAKYGDGMIIKPNKTRLKATFNTASHSLGSLRIPCGDIPDVGRLSGPVNRLRKLIDECSDDLDSLSRLLGRKPDRVNTLEALALLPVELLDSIDNPQSKKIREWLKEQIGENQQAYVDASELVRMWLSSKSDKLTKKESISLTYLLDKFGYGLEPDPRFGGANLKSEGEAVLFKLPKDAPRTASREYHAASILLRLAATISGTDGVVADSERDYLKTHLEDALKMSKGEKSRLNAHLDWLLHNPPGLAGIKRKVDSLKKEEKKGIALFCIGVAGADGHIDPSEIKTLTKLYPILGLSANDVFTHIHSMMSSVLPHSASRPVTVQTADASAKGYAIPAMPIINEMTSKGVDLDMGLIQMKLKETAKVMEILGGIFQEDELEKSVPEPLEEGFPTICTLDVAHTKLFKALIKREQWSRAEFEELAEKFGLLPDGALDLINEAAYEICDEPLCDGDDPISVEMEIVKEMIA